MLVPAARFHAAEIKRFVPVRDIVVHSPDFRNWHASVRYAAQLAASTQATLTGLYTAAHRGPAPGPPLLVDEVTAYAQDELHQAMLAGRRFAEWADQLGAHEARWQVAIGQAADALALAGNWNDVVVVQGGTPPFSPGERVVGEILLSGVACIVVPETCMAPGRVLRAVVAWNGTAASNRALHGALPLLKAAASVTLLQPRPDRSRNPATADALSHLRAHGIPVTAVNTIAEKDESASEQLLTHIAEQRADLLVMGASVHRRLGERWFGPTTREVISKSQVPVLLQH
jgi:nucleotide-binding universal stress UspA family protein